MGCWDDRGMRKVVHEKQDDRAWHTVALSK